MLHIVLLILKIIGIILLVILGLLLAVLLLVLLVPIRYRLDGSYRERLKGTVRVTWLLHILSIRVSYDEDLTFSFRVLGWNLLRKSSPPDREEKVDRDSEAKKSVARQDMEPSGGPEGYGTGEPEGYGTGEPEGYGAGRTGGCGAEEPESHGAGRTEGRATGQPQRHNAGKPEVFHTESRTDHRAADTAEYDAGKPKVLDMEELINLDLEELKDLTIERDQDRAIREQSDLGDEDLKDLADRVQIQEIQRMRGIKRLKSRIRNRITLVLEKLKFLFKRVCDTLKHIKEVYKVVLDFLKVKENQETLKLILRQLKALLGDIRPGKASGTIVFGFEDPYTTGQVLSAASIVYAWYGPGIEIVPMFDQDILEGELSLKGRIRLATVLYRGLLVYLNKNFRVLLDRWQLR